MAKLLISNPIWSPRNFFQRLYLDNVPSYHPIQKGEMAKNLILDPILTELIYIWARHCCKLSLYAISRKIMNQTQENDKKPSWDPQFFSWILPLLNVRHCCKLSLYVILRKPNETNLRKGKKPSFRTNFRSKIFFMNFTCTTCQTLSQAIIECSFNEN